MTLCQNLKTQNGRINMTDLYFTKRLSACMFTVKIKFIKDVFVLKSIICLNKWQNENTEGVLWPYGVKMILFITFLGLL